MPHFSTEFLLRPANCSQAVAATCSAHVWYSHNVFHPFVNPFPNCKFSKCPILKEFTEDNFKFDENGRKFSKRLENTAGKKEIAHYEQFLLFLQCFQKTYTPDT